MLFKKENKKCQFSFFNSGSTSSLVLALKMEDYEVFVNYKVLDLQVSFPWPQESSQSSIEAKRYG